RWSIGLALGLDADDAAAGDRGAASRGCGDDEAELDVGRLLGRDATRAVAGPRHWRATGECCRDRHRLVGCSLDEVIDPEAHVLVVVDVELVEELVGADLFEVLVAGVEIHGLGGVDVAADRTRGHRAPFLRAWKMDWGLGTPKRRATG